MTSSPRRNTVLFSAALLSSLILAAAGGLLSSDRPGLRLEFFLLDTAWGGEPLYREVRPPRIDDPADLGGAAKAIFSLRWTGWIEVDEPGRHRFSLWAEDAGYLSIDGSRILDTTTSVRQPLSTTRVKLTAGLHPIEVGLVQRDRDVHRDHDLGIGIEWTPPGGVATVLPAELLYPRRPGGPGLFVRRLSTLLTPLGARMLGALLLLAALLAIRRAWQHRPRGWDPGRGRDLARSVLDRLPGRLRGPLASRDVLLGVLLVALFLVVWSKALSWSVATFGGDDAAYIKASQFGPDTGWYFNRMAHVYLVKLFVALFGGGDTFFGSRVYASFTFAVTLAALAVAVRSLGPRLQPRTLVLVLFVVFSQPLITGGIGAAFADHTLMMVLTVAAAVHLHGKSVESSRPRHEWHAFALGVLTLIACKSKETGVIIFFLPALFLWVEGSIDPRRFRRRLRYWLAGLGLALLALMTADAIWMDDFWWAVRPSNYGSARIWLSDGAAGPQPPEAGWMNVIWPPGGTGAALALGNLWILTLAAPLVAAARRESLERRLFYLFPATYLLMLVVIYSRVPNALFSGRILGPILPVACLVAGSLFYHLGIERPSWSRLTAPRCLVPLFLAAAVIVVLVTPYRGGELTAEALVPVDFAARFGWGAEQFLREVQLPIVLLGAVVLATFAFHQPRARLAVLLIATLGALDVSFRQTTHQLSRRATAQAGEMILYPLRAFEREIEAVRPTAIHVTSDVVWRLGMIGRARSSVVSIYFDRLIFVSLGPEIPADAELAIASRRAWERWRSERPELEASATFDPSGQLVLVRLRDARRCGRHDRVGRG